jgi:phosphoribosylglycinamide formyltransferase-1
VNVGFCVSGNGSLFQAAVTHRAFLQIAPTLLITEKKAAANLESFSSRNQVRCVRLDPRKGSEFEDNLTRELIGADLDLIVLTFDRILPADVVQHYAGRLINVHPALLPAFAGMHGMERTLASGVRFGGGTIHDVVEEVDAGPVIAQGVVGTIPGEPLAAYGRRIYELLEPMFLQTLLWFREGRVERDANRQIVIRGARYGTLPVSPALEHFGLPQ